MSRSSSADFVWAILAQAWASVTGIKKAFWGAFSLLILFIVGLHVLLGFLLVVCNIFQTSTLRAGCQFVLNGIIEIVHLFSDISLSFLALHHIRKQKIHATMVFEYCKDWRLFVCIGVAVYLLSIGLLLGTHAFFSQWAYVGLPNVLAEIFWVVFLIFIYNYIVLVVTMTMLVILDKPMRLKDSFKMVFVAINRHWFRNIVVVLLACLLFLLFGVMTVGIGFIWLLPFLSLVSACQYQQIFCSGKFGFSGQESRV
jgi:hypothetical protein